MAQTAHLLARTDGHVRMHRVGRVTAGMSAAPSGGFSLARRLRALGRPPVLVHTSLRPRALARDLGLAAIARAVGSPVILWAHGDDPRLRGVFRAGASAVGAAAVCVLTDAQEAALRGAGVAVHRVTAAWDPALAAAGLASPERSRRWLFLGRLTSAKGVWPLVRAAAAVPGLGLDLAGSGPERDRLDAWIADRGLGGRIRCVGWLGPEAKAAALRSAAGLVLPSRREACPVAVLEAMGLGLPVVATRTGAVPDLVGMGGRLVERASEGSLAGALDALDRQPALRASLGARNAQAAASWTAPVVAEQVFRICRARARK